MIVHKEATFIFLGKMTVKSNFKMTITDIIVHNAREEPKTPNASGEYIRANTMVAKMPIN